jgi:hypothetical protein
LAGFLNVNLAGSQLPSPTYRVGLSIEAWLRDKATQQNMSISEIANLSRRDRENNRREHDQRNGEHEQRWVPDMRSKPKRTANRRSEIVTPQAATIITAVGAT